MGLFKSSEERRIERDMSIRKGINTVKRQIRSLHKDEKEYLKKAKKARQLGSKGQVDFIKNALKRTLAHRRLMERQLLNVETLYQMKNQVEVHGEFAKSLQSISTAISDVFEKANLTETQKNLEMSMAKADTMEQQIDMLLDASESMMGSELSVEGEIVSDDEIDALLEEEIAHEEGKELDSEIDQGLSEIEKELGQG